MAADFLWDDQRIVARVENGEVFSADDNNKIATLRDGQLYTLSGEPTGIYLQHLEHGSGSPAALAALRKLLTP
jgi:hypothetical protein